MTEHWSCTSMSYIVSSQMENIPPLWTSVEMFSWRYFSRVPHCINQTLDFVVVLNSSAMREPLPLDPVATWTCWLFSISLLRCLFKHTSYFPIWSIRTLFPITFMTSTTNCKTSLLWGQLSSVPPAGCWCQLLSSLNNKLWHHFCVPCFFHALPFSDAHVCSLTFPSQKCLVRCLAEGQTQTTKPRPTLMTSHFLCLYHRWTVNTVFKTGCLTSCLGGW